jgi:hypothetical protein
MFGASAAPNFRYIVNLPGISRCDRRNNRAKMVSQSYRRSRQINNTQILPQIVPDISYPNIAHRLIFQRNHIGCQYLTNIGTKVNMSIFRHWKPETIV